MQKFFKITVLLAGIGVSTWAHSAPGEYWEVTSKMEMVGMPMAMPATTIKVCIPKGAERDPHYSTDKSCVISDVKTSGNKTSWSMRCNQDGQILNGTGEMSGTPDSAQGKMHLVGSGKQAFEMNQTYSNKRLGGSCDADEMANKMKAQAAQMQEQACRTSSDVVQQVYMADRLMDEKTCPGKKQAFCDAIRTQASKNSKIFGAISDHDKNSKTSIASGCGIDMEAASQSVCKTFNRNNADELSRHCPAEAKAYRENERRKACEGRSFTAREDLSKCLAGKADSDEDPGTSSEATPRAKAKTQTKSVVNPSASNPPAVTEPPVPVAIPNSAEALIDSAKKLKGLFGF